MKIDAETWSKLTKSQKRTARKKLAAEKLSLAIKASDRRDADFIARHTGCFSRKIGDVKMLKLTAENKQDEKMVTTIYRESHKGNAFNVAEVTCANLEQSRFEPALAERIALNSMIKKQEFKTAGDQMNAMKRLREVSETMNSDLLELKKLFTLEHDFHNLNGIVSDLQTAVDSAKLQYDEIAKSGNKKGLSTAEKSLQELTEKLNAAKKSVNDFLNAAAIKL